jgi:hypothetical protein
MMESFSFQGISDSVAGSYLDVYGNATWAQIKAQIARKPPCSLLRGYWTYHGCQYDKTRRTCSEMSHFDGCPVPVHPLRNGRLNQTAFSFFLFVRDVAGSDLFRWIDDQFDEADGLSQAARQEALIGPMRHIFGVSDKVLTMTLSSLLMADRENRPDRFVVGSQMIVIDRLVHNFLARTGILKRCAASHPYGPACYSAGNCADILKSVSAEIDARQFEPTYPPNFPRYTQHALWRYCAADALNICNGNTIDDRKSCENTTCTIFDICLKVALKSQ